ncbi:MAG: hypothetical protein Q8P75_04275 [bacterium]|nr:hypothetical protein [bacterium]
MLKQKVFLGKVALAILIVWGAFFSSTPNVAAVESDVLFDTDTPIALTLEGRTRTFLVGDGSRAVSIQVGASSITVIVGTAGEGEDSDTFTLQNNASTPAMNFLINSAYDPVTTCSGGFGSVSLSNTATTTYIIAPQPDNLCETGASGSSSGGGGGGGGGVTTPTTPTVPAETPSVTAPVAGAHPNGTLILDNGTIYLVVEGKKRGFRNPEEYFSHGYKFAQAVAANDADRSLSDSDEPIEKALDGTLALDKTDNRTIYMIAGGQKRGFTSAEVFHALGYQFNQAVPIDLGDYPAGDPITGESTTHPNGALLLDKNDGRTVWWVLNGQRQGFQSAEVFFTYGFSFGKIVPATDADMALAEGALVKFRDGTIVADGSDYYLISEGKKRKFVNLEAMQNLGYQMTNAIAASLGAYKVGDDIN